MLPKFPSMLYVYCQTQLFRTLNSFKGNSVSFRWQQRPNYLYESHGLGRSVAPLLAPLDVAGVTHGRRFDATFGGRSGQGEQRSTPCHHCRLVRVMFCLLHRSEMIHCCPTSYISSQRSDRLDRLSQLAVYRLHRRQSRCTVHEVVLLCSRLGKKSSGFTDSRMTILWS